MDTLTQVRTNTLLEVKHLSVDYESAKGAVHAVTDVSFAIERGQIFGLAGESGSGKSTLAYAIARLLQPPAVITQGQVMYYPRPGGSIHDMNQQEKFVYSSRSPIMNSHDQDRECHAERSEASPGHSGETLRGVYPRAKLVLNEVNGRRAQGDTLLSTVNVKKHYRGTDPCGRPVDCDGDAVVDVLALNPAQLRAFRWHDLSIVFQSAMNALNPVLNIEVQITDVLRAHNPIMTRQQARSRAVELLRLVGIAPDRLRSYPHELSGGMRQRAIIAIALALDPEIIIMDEPTTALDVVVQRDILAQIMRLRQDFGFSVIFITHDLSLLLEIADTIAIMYAGRIVEMATQENVYRHPLHPYTYGLLNSFPSLRGPRRKRVSIPGSPPDLRSVPPGCAFHPRCAFSFAACRTIVPELLHGTYEGAKRSIEAPPLDSLSSGKQLTHVACHLYDAALNPEGPPESLESENVNQHCNVNQ